MKRKARPRGSRSRPSAVDKLRPAEATELLRALLTRHPELSVDAASMAQAMITRVSAEDVAAAVEEAILALDIDALGARAGEHADGYTEPAEAAWELLQAARGDRSVRRGSPAVHRSRLRSRGARDLSRNRRRPVSHPRQERRGGPRVGGGLPRRSRSAGGIDATRDRPRLSAMVAAERVRSRAARLVLASRGVATRTRMTADTQQG